MRKLELAQIYIERGLTTDLAHQVAGQFDGERRSVTHALGELGISEMTTARPIQAALTSGATFAVGAAMPLAIVLVAPAASLVWAVSAASLLFLCAAGRNRREGRRSQRHEGNAASFLLGRLCDDVNCWIWRADLHGSLSEWPNPGEPVTRHPSPVVSSRAHRADELRGFDVWLLPDVAATSIVVRMPKPLGSKGGSHMLNRSFHRQR